MLREWRGSSLQLALHYRLFDVCARLASVPSIDAWMCRLALHTHGWWLPGEEDKWAHERSHGCQLMPHDHLTSRAFSLTPNPPFTWEGLIEFRDHYQLIVTFAFASTRIYASLFFSIKQVKLASFCLCRSRFTWQQLVFRHLASVFLTTCPLLSDDVVGEKCETAAKSVTVFYAAVSLSRCPPVALFLIRTTADDRPVRHCTSAHHLHWDWMFFHSMLSSSLFYLLFIHKFSITNFQLVGKTQMFLCVEECQLELSGVSLQPQHALSP